jgi:cellulose synthase/poly-beta-1,6-N-acetylglucosamine synthase-like glycosyltransferase
MMQQMTRRPSVSVIIPTYNRTELLRRTLDALTEQSISRDEFEVIVSDDGSTDNTSAVVQSFADRLDVRYCHQQDRGYRVAEARNAGARLASAPILVFLDSGQAPTCWARIWPHTPVHLAKWSSATRTVISRSARPKGSRRRSRP